MLTSVCNCICGCTSSYNHVAPVRPGTNDALCCSCWAQCDRENEATHWPKQTKVLVAKPEVLPKEFTIGKARFAGVPHGTNESAKEIVEPT